MGGVSDGSAAGGLSAAEVARVRAYVDRNLTNGLSVRELASAVGRSESCFARLFRAATGMTPRRFVLARRVERARALILAPNRMSLSEVAAACGFADQAHLGRTFKRITGQTPARFCRAHGRAPR